MDWSNIIRDIAFPIGNTLLIVTYYYHYKTGKRSSEKKQRNVALVLLMVFIIITPVILYMDDKSRDVLIDVGMGVSSLLGIGYFLYYLPKMMNYLFPTNQT